MSPRKQLRQRAKSFIDTLSVFSYPDSSRAYILGRRSNIRVPTNLKHQIDLYRGLPKLREEWIDALQDTEDLQKISSEYAQERLNDSTLDQLRCSSLPRIKHAILSKVAHFCAMKISQEVREFANNQQVYGKLDTNLVEYPLEGMKRKSQEFIASGAELYHPKKNQPQQ